MTIQKTETKLANLKINRLTKKMYDDALVAGTLNPNELYLTDEDIIPTGQEMDKNIYDPNNVQKNIFASIPGYNLLDNDDFTKPINQRGAGNYSGGGVYSIDRWKVYLTTLTVNEGSCSILRIGYGGALYQYVESDLNSTYTFTVKTSDGIVSVTGIPTANSEKTIGNTAIRIGTYGTYIQVSIWTVNTTNAVTLYWAKLEEGSVATTYVPKGYGTELNECRRYYQRVFFSMRLTNNTVGITFNPPMRVAPTLSFTEYAAGTTPTVTGVGIYGGWLSIPESNYYTGYVIASADL